MVVSAIQAPHVVDTAVQNHTNSHSSDSFQLDNLVEPASSHDVSAFQSTVQGIIQQNAAGQAAVNTTYSANSAGSFVTSMIDQIQASKREIQSLASKGGNLSSKEALQLQEEGESYTLNVQLLSKGVTLATKAIDTVFHMQ